jgi:predicted ATPase/DNA-binding SARP family transcriptional activator
MTVDRTALAVRVDVLGPLALHVEGAPVTVPGLRRRALLAVLALSGGRTVGMERLVDALWPEEPPDNAVQALYNHVSRLRGHLGPRAHRLERHAAGYRLHLEPDELDVDAARRLARTVTAAGTSPPVAADLARTALELWRGPALEEFRALPALEMESMGIDELRQQLLDDVLAARIADGDRSATADAAAAASAAPLRVRSTLLLMRALAADGRAAEAMAAGTAFRRLLVEETGLDPGPGLAELEQAIAAGSLEDRPRPPRSPPAVLRPDGPLVGRGHDREEVLRLLGGNGTVTLTGPGGVGKTRLALDVAAEIAVNDAVVVVHLAAVDRPGRVCQAVASTLGLRTAAEVTASDVADALADRRLLLVLDNCEHVPEACRDLVETVRQRAASVRVLATSRVTLHVPGEYVVRLQPLPVPREAGDPEALMRHPGVRAFLEHARRAGSDYQLCREDIPHLVEVLRQLDGLPLGIELAACQVTVMPLRAIRERLDRALDLATGSHAGDDGRQQTLRATINSSYRLLDDDERRLLRALAAFPGGVDLDTVEALAADVAPTVDPLVLLHRLVDASLVVADAATARYRLLFTVRAFLIDALRQQGELSSAEERFLDRCLALAQDLGWRLHGPDEATADRLLRDELDNLRAARDVALTHGRDDVRVGVTLALDEAAAWRDLRELWAWALELAADPRLADHPDRAAVLGCAAEAARLTGDLDRASLLADEAFAVAGPDPEPAQVRRAWAAKGSVAHFRGDFGAASVGWQRGSEHPKSSGSLLASAALAASYGGDVAAARGLLDRAHATIALSQCGSHAAFAAYVEGEIRATVQVEESVPFYLDAIEGARRGGATFVEGVASVALASARTRIGDVAGAASGFGYLIDFWRRTGQSTQLWTTARNAAGLLSVVGRSRTAALLLLSADAEPGAAAVGPEIARFSGRAFTPVTDLVPEPELAELRAEAARLGAAAVLDLAATELRELADVRTPAPATGTPTAS